MRLGSNSTMELRSNTAEMMTGYAEQNGGRSEHLFGFSKELSQSRVKTPLTLVRAASFHGSALSKTVGRAEKTLCIR